MVKEVRESEISSQPDTPKDLDALENELEKLGVVASDIRRLSEYEGLSSDLQEVVFTHLWTEFHTPKADGTAKSYAEILEDTIDHWSDILDRKHTPGYEKRKMGPENSEQARKRNIESIILQQRGEALAFEADERKAKFQDMLKEAETEEIDFSIETLDDLRDALFDRSNSGIYIAARIFDIDDEKYEALSSVQKIAVYNYLDEYGGLPTTYEELNDCISKLVEQNT